MTQINAQSLTHEERAFLQQRQRESVNGAKREAARDVVDTICFVSFMAVLLAFLLMFA
jgi:hypothetical protein